MPSTRSSAWYATPADQGDCGDECYTAPTAWIDQEEGNYAFGVSCDATLILGGSAMEVSQLPFSAAEMIIDGKSFGHFSIDSGLNDVFVSPDADNGRTPNTVQKALESGARLQLIIVNGPALDFTLKGSKTAIATTMKACQNN